jgi:hypothetical protein
MMLLGDVMARFARGISISVPLKSIDKSFCNSLSTAINSSKGSIPLKVFITNDGMSLTMMPRGSKVEPKKFLKAIKQIGNITNVKVEG